MNAKGVFEFFHANTIQPIVGWIFPSTCLVCGNSLFDRSQFVCQACWFSLPRASDLDLETLWLARTGNKLYFQGFYASFLFTQAIQNIIHHFKYGRKTKLAKEIVRQIIPELLNKPEITSCDWIVPIPLNKHRLNKRGYNQSELLSKEISHYLKIPAISTLLVRNRNTASQTQLNADQRLVNVKDAFEVSNSQFVRNASILLVDDLITTGATANECAKVLQREGAKKIYVLAIARPL